MDGSPSGSSSVLLSVEFSRQEYWSRLPFPTPRDFPNPGIEPGSLAPLAFSDGFFTAVPLGSPHPILDLSQKAEKRSWVDSPKNPLRGI